MLHFPLGLGTQSLGVLGRHPGQGGALCPHASLTRRAQEGGGGAGREVGAAAQVFAQPRRQALNCHQHFQQLPLQPLHRREAPLPASTTVRMAADGDEEDSVLGVSNEAP